MRQGSGCPYRPHRLNPILTCLSNPTPIIRFGVKRVCLQWSVICIFYASQSLVRRSRVDESARLEYSSHIFSAYHSRRSSRATRLDVSMAHKWCRWAKRLLTVDTFYGPFIRVQETSYLRIRRISFYSYYYRTFNGSLRTICLKSTVYWSIIRMFTLYLCSTIIECLYSTLDKNKSSELLRYPVSQQGSW